MDSKGMISVVIPLYNIEAYIGKCIESVLAQTCENMEILLIDDGSDDQSGAVCDAYARKDTRIRVLHQKHGGVGAARNAGIAEAVGEYIYFLDGDDFIAPSLLQMAKDAIERENSDVCCFGYVRVSESGEELYTRQFDDGIYEIAAEEDKFEFMARKYFYYRCGSEVWNRLYRRKIIQKKSLRFEDQKLVQGEDMLFNFHYLLYTDRVVVLPDAPYFYRERANSLLQELKQAQLKRYHKLMLYAWDYVQISRNKKMADYFFVLYGIFLLDGWRRVFERRGAEGIREEMEAVENAVFAQKQMQDILSRPGEINRYCGQIRGRMCRHILKMVCHRSYGYNCFRYKGDEVLLRLSVRLHRKGRKKR